MTEPKEEPTDILSASNKLSRIRQLISPYEPPSLKAQMLFWGLFISGLALDLWSKWAVFQRLPRIGDMTVVIPGFLNLVHAENDGAAFGICAGQPLFLASASIIALILVLGYFYLFRIKELLVDVALGMLAAGIGGNMYDRLFNAGIVRDFIDVYITISGKEYRWHTFNIADALLCIGVAMLIIWTGFSGKSGQKCDRQQK
ncbi:MAG: signal peptidase II [Planctomycetota bacterium]